MDPREMGARRMRNLRLWGTPFATIAETVGWLGALQAQEFAYALWSVAQRTANVDRAAMEQAFADGAVLRTHLLRPTWHFVLPGDIRWLLALTGPRIHARNARRYRELGLDAKLRARADRLLADAVRGGRHRTRAELVDVLRRAGIEATGVRFAYLAMHAELEGVLCSGTPKGKQQTYALLDERAPKAVPFERDGALADLMRRYLAARGPATLKDFAWWSGLTAADGRRAVEGLGADVVREDIEGRTYWFAHSRGTAVPRSPRIDLVQGYDEVIIAYRDSRDVLFPPSGGGALPREGAFSHAILLDGRLIGHWRAVPERGSVRLQTSTYRDLRRAESRALADAIERYGRYLGSPVTV